MGNGSPMDEWMKLGIIINGFEAKEMDLEELLTALVDHAPCANDDVSLSHTGDSGGLATEGTPDGPAWNSKQDPSRLSGFPKYRPPLTEHVALVIILALVLLAPAAGSRGLGHGCRSPQYLQLWKPGIINCSFPGEHPELSWFDSASYPTDEPLIGRNDQGAIEGRGYRSGEYDIAPKGSLLIKNVTSEHEHEFSVLKIENPVVNSTAYIVEVRPIPPAFPEVDGCFPNEYCVLRVEDHNELKCRIRGVPQHVRLEFKVVSPTSAQVSFEHPIITMPCVGDYCDVSLSTRYQVVYTPRLTVAIECGVVPPNDELIRETKILTLVLSDSVPETTIFQEPTLAVAPPNDTPGKLIVIPFVLGLFAVITIIIIIITWYRCRRVRRASTV